MRGNRRPSTSDQLGHLQGSSPGAVISHSQAIRTNIRTDPTAARFIPSPVRLRVSLPERPSRHWMKGSNNE
eukprot:3426237-Alexandrium_andersonii.AAC.1